MRNPTFKHLGAVAALGLVPACATLSSNIGGDFSCPAPKGRCAPASVIDAEALGALASPPKSGAIAASMVRTVAPHAQLAARTGETILRIVLPAHVDTDGLMRDEAAVYAVVAAPHWVAERGSPAAKARPRDAAKRISQANKAVETAPGTSGAEPAPAGSERFSPTLSIDDAQTDAQIETQPDISLSRERNPPPFREAVAGASSPAIEGFAHSPLPRTPQLFAGQDDIPSQTFPSAAALEAARRGHRIGMPVPANTAPIAGIVGKRALAEPQVLHATAPTNSSEPTGTKREYDDQKGSRR